MQLTYVFSELGNGLRRKSLPDAYVAGSEPPHFLDVSLPRITIDDRRPGIPSRTCMHCRCSCRLSRTARTRCRHRCLCNPC